MPLSRTFYARDAVAVARDLLGKELVIRHPQGLKVGRIVETEAYQGPADLAAHSAGGRRTARTEIMYGPAGHAYVYLAYGVSYMLNVSSEAAGVGAGVLIRALEPLEGVAAMQRRRGTETLRDLARGPGRLAAALDIDRRLDGVDLCKEGPLWIAHDSRAALEIGTSTRIGLTREADRPLRFYVRGSPFVSGPKALNR